MQRVAKDRKSYQADTSKTVCNCKEDIRYENSENPAGSNPSICMVSFVPTLMLFHRRLAHFIELNLRYMFVTMVEGK